MLKKTCFLTLFIGLMVVGCGPDTIFVRPGLDTPDQHVFNGNQLLKRGKVDDACREFVRAKELDANHVMAYVGLGVALGKKGDIEAGLKIMAQAKQLASSAKEHSAVHQGYDELLEMKRMNHGNPSPSQ